MRTPSAGVPGLTDRWREQAACRSTDPELFFPVGSTGPVLEEIQAAKAVCARCPVSQACLQFALDTNQDTGIWGGTTEEERRRLRRSRVAIRPTGVAAGR